MQFREQSTGRLFASLLGRLDKQRWERQAADLVEAGAVRIPVVQVTPVSRVKEGVHVFFSGLAWVHLLLGGFVFIVLLPDILENGLALFVDTSLDPQENEFMVIYLGALFLVISLSLVSALQAIWKNKTRFELLYSRDTGIRWDLLVAADGFHGLLRIKAKEIKAYSVVGETTLTLRVRTRPVYFLFLPYHTGITLTFNSKAERDKVAAVVAGY